MPTASRAVQVSGHRGVGPNIRVCHVIHSLQRAGAEHVLVDLAAVAPEAGLEIAVVSLMPVPPLSFAGQLRALGVPVVTLGLVSRWDPRALPRGVETVRRLDPDVIHTHLKHADIVGAAAAQRLGTPMVSTLHLIENAGAGVARLKRSLAAQARQRLAQRTVAVSDAQRRWYLETFGADPSRVVTVHNGVRAPGAVSEERRQELRAQLGISPGSLMATMVAVMRPGKGHHDLLAAARLIDSDVTFVLAGDGELRPQLEAAAGAAGDGARVVFAGFRDDVADLLAASDLVVHPSHADALPTALLHALASGRPVIASDVGGIPEIVTREAGVLVPPGDPERLAAAVVGLARDPAARERLGSAGRRRFDEEFDALAWAHRLRLVYREAMGARSGPTR